MTLPLTHTVHIRCWGELEDFLPPLRRGCCFDYTIKGCPSIKDTLEAIGIPHVAVDTILINGRGCDFSCQLKEGDDVKVYPPGHDLKAGNVLHLVSLPAKIHFIADSHLGKLARDLRLLGFSVLYWKGSHYRQMMRFIGRLK